MWHFTELVPELALVLNPRWLTVKRALVQRPPQAQAPAVPSCRPEVQGEHTGGSEGAQSGAQAGDVSLLHVLNTLSGHGSGAVLHVQLLPLTRGPHGAWAHTSAAVTTRAVCH